MRFIRISQKELVNIKKLYESVMSHASYGLFFREGEVLGREIADMASADQSKFLETAARLIKGRGWVEDIRFEDSRVVVKGSFESYPGARDATCHRLRGIIHVVMERHLGRRLLCLEDKCCSLGDANCEFILSELEGTTHD